MKKMAVGVMSGTSLDGIDVVLASIEGSYQKTRVQMLAYELFPFSSELKLKIKDAMRNETTSLPLITSLNMELGYAFGYAAKSLVEKEGYSLDQINFVASHGQTIWHINEDDGKYVKSSLQLGDGSAIASIVKTTVVSNFRLADIASGGIGAPLVPYVDYLLFSDQKKSRSLHNLGGISNMTVLKANGTEDDVFAFDTGPANLMIDQAMMTLYGKPYDDNGNVARSGEVITDMLYELMSHPYLKMEPPKSTGRELFGDHYTEMILNRYKEHKKEDIVRTLTQFTADSIVKAYHGDVLNHIKLDEIIFSGGGAYNSYLLELIENELKPIQIKKLEDYHYDSKAKEALAFLVLGNETLNHQPSNMLGATGAKHKAILGQINYFR